MRHHCATIIGGLFAIALIGCDGPQEKAGKQADAVAGAPKDAAGEGPQERLGKIEDRTARDRKRAVEANADAMEDRADRVRSVARQRVDALDSQPAAIRQDAQQSAGALDQQAKAIRSQQPGP